MAAITPTGRSALVVARARLEALQEAALELGRHLEEHDGLELADYPRELPAFEEIVHGLAGVRVAEPARPMLILRQYGSAYELGGVGELIQYPLSADGSVDSSSGGGAVDAGLMMGDGRESLELRLAYHALHGLKELER